MLESDQEIAQVVGSKQPMTMDTRSRAIAVLTNALELCLSIGIKPGGIKNVVDAYVQQAEVSVTPISMKACAGEVELAIHAFAGVERFNLEKATRERFGFLKMSPSSRFRQQKPLPAE